MLIALEHWFAESLTLQLVSTPTRSTSLLPKAHNGEPLDSHWCPGRDARFQVNSSPLVLNGFDSFNAWKQQTAAAPVQCLDDHAIVRRIQIFGPSSRLGAREHVHAVRDPSQFVLSDRRKPRITSSRADRVLNDLFCNSCIRRFDRAYAAPQPAVRASKGDKYTSAFGQRALNIHRWFEPLTVEDELLYGQPRKLRESYVVGRTFHVSGPDESRAAERER